MNLELSPCPFCGAKPAYQSVEGILWLRCSQCRVGIDPRWYGGDLGATEASWNDRTDPEWFPMNTVKDDGTIIILLARIDGSEPGCEHPIIGHFIDGDWHNLSYAGDASHRLIPIGWMPRPEFVMARERMARETSSI